MARGAGSLGRIKRSACPLRCLMGFPFTSTYSPSLFGNGSRFLCKHMRPIHMLFANRQVTGRGVVAPLPSWHQQRSAAAGRQTILERTITRKSSVPGHQTVGPGEGETVMSRFGLSLLSGVTV